MDSDPAVAPSLISIRPDEGVEDLDLDTPAVEAAWETLTGAAPSPGLALGPELGRGGSAIVRLAQQHSLGREVAVKTVRPDLASEGLRRILLREARVTGSLEHPNIVPVHDVIADEEGQPLIVLKRLTGRTWHAAMHDTDGWAAREEPGDLLGWNIGVLVQLCRAVHYAHSRGVVHRDLKPANVMLGEHGEVTLVDWGLAARTDPDGDPWLPLAADVTRPAGTPAYMAPEQAGGGPVTHRTDVFLLGACLVEVLTGRPPYAGPVDDALFETIRAAEFPLPAGLPEVLVTITRRATAADPAQRHESADALRRDLESALRRRGVDALVRQAAQGLDGLRQAIAVGVRSEELVYLHGPVRFGFEQALSTWPGHPDARQGLVDATVAMVTACLDDDDPAAARVHLAELDDPPPALSSRLVQAESRAARDRHRLAALTRQEDPREGRQLRLALLGLLGAVWTLSPLLTHRLEQGNPAGISLVSFTLWIGAMLAIIAGVSWWQRETLARSRMTRDSVMILALTLVAQTMLDLGFTLAGFGMLWAHAFHPLVWGLGASVAAAVVDRRLAWSAVVFWAGFLVSAARPETISWVVGATNGVFCLNAAWLWRSRPPPHEA